MIKAAFATRIALRREWRAAKAIFSAIAAAYLIGSLAEDVEGYIAPPIREIAFDVYQRDDEKICWLRSLKKLRDVPYEFFAWTVQDARDPMTRMSVSPYDPATHLPRAVSVLRKSDRPIQIKQCFDLPLPLRGYDRPLVFEAYARYETWHHLWSVGHHVEPFRIDGMMTHKVTSPLRAP